MNNQTDIFTLKEVIKPRRTLTSFGYRTVISPDNNTIVVLDAENSFTTFYTRKNINTNSSFTFSNQFAKPEFKHQFILTEAIFNEESDRCYVGVKYCDYVNYDLDVRRNSFLISGIVYIKQITQVPVTLENTVIYEKKAIWSYFTSLPYVDPNGYQLIHNTLNNEGLYALTNTSGNYNKLYYQSLNSINIAIQYSISALIVVDPPVYVGVLDNMKKIQFATLNAKRDNYVVYSYNINQNLYKRKIIPTSLEGETLIMSGVYNFSINGNRLVYDKLDKIEIYNLDDSVVEYSYVPQITDINSILVTNMNYGRIVHISNATNQLKIYGDKEYTYSNNYPYSYANFNELGNTLVVGQPKNGKVIVFYYDQGWSFFQELTLDGFSVKFDIDADEKTLVVTNNTERITDIYENISYDLSTFQKSSVDLVNGVSSTDVEKYFESINMGYKNIILSSIEYGTRTSYGNLYSDIPYYIPSNGNVLFTIYEAIVNENYIYHIYANDISGNNFESQSKLLIYTQSGRFRLKNIASDRSGETIILLRQDELIQLYKRVNLNETEETYAYIRLDRYDFRDFWTDINYDPRVNGGRTAIDKVQFNNRGNIIVVQQGPNVIVLHYQQELLIRQKTIGNPSLLTDPSDSLIPEPKEENGYKYIYFRNYYYLLSSPVITYILNESILLIDENDVIYTWNNDKINVYSEDNFYRTKIETIPFQSLLIENIRFFPEEKLFTYKDNTNIYFYYYDKVNHSFINTNVSIPVVERYQIIDNHLIHYQNKNLQIDRYMIDVLQNQSQVDLSLNTIYTDTIDTSYNLVNMSIDYRNNINIFFKNLNNNCRCYHYTPTSRNDTKYKYMITFREQKIDSDVQYKHEEFYNNVIQVLPKNYVANVANVQSQSQESSTERENQFKIYCAQKFTYTAETNNSEIHTFTPNFNKNVYYDNEIIVSKYFDPKTYTTLNSVLRYMNGVNNNRALSLYRITEKRYVGIIATMKGGTNLVKHKYTLIDKDDDIKLIESRAYTSEVTERLSSVGMKFYVVNDDSYTQGSIPEVQGRVSGIYLTSEIPIRDELRIRYEVDLSSVEVGTPQIFYPQDIQIYLMTELTIDIITEETIQNSPFIGSNEIDYGKFTNISADGNIIVIGSDLNTISNVVPQVVSKKKEFNIWIVQSFIDAEADFSIGGGNQSGGRDDMTFYINWDVNYNGKDDEDVNKYIDLTTFNRIQKLEDYVNLINGYYGVEIIKLRYQNYYAVQAQDVGGLGGRRMWFSVNGTVMIKSTDTTRWGQEKSLTSPSFANTDDLVVWTGVSPPGGKIFENNAYYLSPDTTRPSSINYSVYYTGGTESYAKNIQISYILNATISFTEEYLQRFHYNVIKYGCMFYYMNQKGRWRHLNTLYFNNSSNKPLRRSKSTVSLKFPDKIEFIGSNLLISSNKNAFLLQNILYDNSMLNINLFNGKNEITIDFNLRITFERKYWDAAFEDESGTDTIVFQSTTKINVSYNEQLSILYEKLNNVSHDHIVQYESLEKFRYLSEDHPSMSKGDEKSNNFLTFLRECIKERYSYKTVSYNYLNIRKINDILEVSLDCIYQDGIYQPRSGQKGSEDPRSYSRAGYKWVENVINNKVIISLSPLLQAQLGLNDLILDKDQNRVIYLNIKRMYQILSFNDAYFGVSINSEILNQRVILGSVDKFQILNKNLTLYNTLTIKDKIGNLYLNDDLLYNAVPEKGLIKKYSLNSTIDLSFNNILTGTQVLQDYSYANFGNTFSIFNDVYGVIGTTEGKVIIQHLSDKNAAKGIINSGSKNYSKFGSVIRTGKYIYINAPELNKLFVLSAIPYYE
jgi:hypothetical protein